MDPLTNLLPQGFEPELPARAFQVLKAEKYLFETWQQILKDFHLSGIVIDEEIEPQDLEQLHQIVSNHLPSIEQIQDRANLFYRIDLPEQVKREPVSIEVLAMAIIIRDFQKVWMRAQYSKAHQG